MILAVPSIRRPGSPMSRKPKKGYYVRGEFVAEGSELDLELKRELKGTPTHAIKTPTDLDGLAEL